MLIMVVPLPEQRLKDNPSWNTGVLAAVHFQKGNDSVIQKREGLPHSLESFHGS